MLKYQLKLSKNFNFVSSYLLLLNFFVVTYNNLDKSNVTKRNKDSAIFIVVRGMKTCSCLLCTAYSLIKNVFIARNKCLFIGKSKNQIKFFFKLLKWMKFSTAFDAF